MARNPFSVDDRSNWRKMINNNRDEKKGVKNKSDLEKIVGEFERSFESPRGTQQRKSTFVKKIVAVIEEKYNNPSPDVTLNSRVENEPNKCDMSPFRNEKLFQNIHNYQPDGTIDRDQIGRTKSNGSSTSNMSEKIRKIPRKLVTKLMGLFSKSNKSFTASNDDVDLNNSKPIATVLPQCRDESSNLDNTISVTSSFTSGSENEYFNYDLYKDLCKCPARIPRPHLIYPQSKQPKPLHEPRQSLSTESEPKDVEIVTIRTRPGRTSLPDYHTATFSTFSDGTPASSKISPKKKHVYSKVNIDNHRATFSTFSDATPTPSKTNPNNKHIYTYVDIGDREYSNPDRSLSNMTTFSPENSWHESYNMKIEKIKKLGQGAVILRRSNRQQESRPSRFSEPSYVTRSRDSRIPRASWNEIGNRYQSIEQLSLKLGIANTLV